MSSFNESPFSSSFGTGSGWGGLGALSSSPSNTNPDGTNNNNSKSTTNWDSLIPTTNNANNNGTNNDNGMSLLAGIGGGLDNLTLSTPPTSNILQTSTPDSLQQRVGVVNEGKRGIELSDRGKCTCKTEIEKSLNSMLGISAPPIPPHLTDYLLTTISSNFSTTNLTTPPTILEWSGKSEAEELVEEHLGWDKEGGGIAGVERAWLCVRDAWEIE
eukprot:CAMPEP_0118662052 /NCGR_PEP_ID=MMETSP0785-20121206/16614_1 /TAXON_ID=91992 /ORGANISM="Bolidomonas pacifica, Strain CCMP 1866" /LENGTH=214 /DNA_ID=CAMNT_0006555547 /DNA_START=231 /DNA_END=872 /DNA_ORIENTATION=-